VRAIGPWRGGRSCLEQSRARSTNLADRARRTPPCPLIHRTTGRGGHRSGRHLSGRPRDDRPHRTRPPSAAPRGATSSSPTTWVTCWPWAGTTWSASRAATRPWTPAPGTTTWTRPVRATTRTSRWDSVKTCLSAAPPLIRCGVARVCRAPLCCPARRTPRSTPSRQVLLVTWSTRERPRWAPRTGSLSLHLDLVTDPAASPPVSTTGCPAPVRTSPWTSPLSARRPMRLSR
jgi:hypothetical protein